MEEFSLKNRARNILDEIAYENMSGEPIKTPYIVGGYLEDYDYGGKGNAITAAYARYVGKMKREGKKPITFRTWHNKNYPQLPKIPAKKKAPTKKKVSKKTQVKPAKKAQSKYQLRKVRNKCYNFCADVRIPNESLKNDYNKYAKGALKRGRQPKTFMDYKKMKLKGLNKKCRKDCRKVTPYVKGKGLYGDDEFGGCYDCDMPVFRKVQNPWISFVKEVQQKNPGITYGEALQIASSMY